jgi:predicted DNA-binding mobile mystery protein A
MTLSVYLYIYKFSDTSIHGLTMSVKTVVQQQYQRIVDAATHQASLRTPPEGWLRTVRKALGMSGAQLAKRMGVTRARVAQAEHAELSGGTTLKSMHAAAAAMGCRFVYAVVPNGRVENLITAQARKKAMALVGTASTHMALESQTLSKDKIAQEIERLTREIKQEMPSDFWSDK